MLDKALFLKPIAHRGLHNKKRGLVENSSGAFLAAISKGYGIECDLRPLQTGDPIVFHDATLKRLLGRDELLSTLHLSDLLHLRYPTSGETILTFNDFLTIVAGRVPILAEIKSDWKLPDLRFLREIVRRTLDYKGPLALMSFDPDVLTVLRELAPEVPRGLVSGAWDGSQESIWDETPLDKKRLSSLAHLEDYESVDPSFCAYHVHSLPQNTRVRLLREVKGLPIFAWTVRTQEELEISSALADAPIFEDIEP